MLNSLRIRFSRSDEVKYISHLDQVRVFERTLRRSNLKISCTEGYNPRYKMVFGLPLSVGVTSEAEYADFELLEDIEPEKFKEVLNYYLPRGFYVIESNKKNDKQNIMALIKLASYLVKLSFAKECSMNDIKGTIDEVMNMKEIVVKKSTKSGTKETDIRKKILNVDVYDNKKLMYYSKYLTSINNNASSKDINKEKEIWMDMLVCAGSVDNLKPELFIEFFGKKINNEINILKIHRTGLYFYEGNDIVDPFGRVQVLSGKRWQNG